MKIKRSIISLLVAGLFAGAGTSVLAQNVTADDQSKAQGQSSTQPGNMPETDSNAKVPAKTNSTDSSNPNSSSRAAKSKAEMDYKTAKDKCKSLTGAAMRSCEKDAIASRDAALRQLNEPGAMNETEPSVAGDEKADSGMSGGASDQQVKTN